MAKIIKINSGEVLIALDNNEVISVPDHSLDFAPVVNDIVEVYEKEGTRIIVKGKQIYSQGGQTTVIIDGKKLVNKWIYVALAFIGGGIGLHKFYAGKIGTGIVYLLFCWTLIPGIIAFIEMIMAIMANEVEPGMILV